jgi:hypothetical protein
VDAWQDTGDTKVLRYLLQQLLDSMRIKLGLHGSIFVLGFASHFDEVLG